MIGSRTRKVWRLECGSTWEGVFYAGIGRKVAADMDASYNRYGRHHCDPYDPPCPDGDWGMRSEWNQMPNPKAFFFGFRSLAQYRKWFRTKAVRRSLKKHGAVLVQYEVPASRAILGHWQVAFDITRARKVKTRCPASV